MKSANAVANRECRKVSEHLGAYVAGRIESAQRGMIAEHLKNCARCCEDVKRFQAVDGLIREMGAKTATPEFTERTGQWVAAAMREEESGETQPVGAFARLGAAPWW